MGGVGRYGVVVEYYSGANSVDLAVGTFAFRDLSLSVVGKRYLRANSPSPYAGIGLWVVTAKPPAGRRGVATVLRVPIGIDWRVVGSHHLGGAANVNRLLAVRRPDALDERPSSGRIIPLPGFYYRFAG